jgi:nucleotide-binding universal stress UspA family protein
MFRDVLIYGDDTPAFAQALGVLEATLDPLTAHVTAAVFRNIPSPAMLYPLEGGAALLASLAEAADKDFHRLAATVAEQMRNLTIPSDVRRVESLMDDMAGIFANHARYADVAVVGLPSGESPRHPAMMVLEQALFDSGRPVLVIPETAPARAIGKTVLVAWNGSREATRALHDAMPILTRAAAVRVVAVDAWDVALRDGEDPAADISRHLARHGVPVEAKVVPSVGKNVAEVMLAEASYVDADMLVLGGYGHSRTREWLVGGATRDLLSSATLPMLLSH